MQRLSIIIPANNEADLIGATLNGVLASEWNRSETVEIILSANACTDDTVIVARSRVAEFGKRGWVLNILDRPEGGKIGALNAADSAAGGDIRVYLDADVTLSPLVLSQLVELLDTDEPRYASGRLSITANGFVSRSYARIWRKVPFMRQGVPGAGLYAMNAAGRARWSAFPDVIADDIFVRLQFTPQERFATQASYDWPIAEGLGALVRVRNRQDRGVIEISETYPELAQNEDKAPFPTMDKLRLALRDPVGFVIYTSVALASKLTGNRASGWSRGR